LGTFSLICHPQTPAKAVKAVSVEWASLGSGLELNYRVAGAGALILPAPKAAARADGLWKTTCFELFLGLAGKAYQEFNFSPSSQWASYAFSDYREGGHDAAITPPQISVRREGDAVVCCVRMAHTDGASSAGLAAVIAEEGGRTSYWALAHDAPRPDFHRRSCFTLAIGAAETP